MRTCYFFLGFVEGALLMNRITVHAYCVLECMCIDYIIFTTITLLYIEVNVRMC